MRARCPTKQKNAQTDELMNVDEEDNLVSAMEAALEEAPREMVLHVKRRNKELKVCRVPSPILR